MGEDTWLLCQADCRLGCRLPLCLRDSFVPAISAHGVVLICPLGACNMTVLRKHGMALFCVRGWRQSKLDVLAYGEKLSSVQAVAAPRHNGWAWSAAC